MGRVDQSRYERDYGGLTAMQSRVDFDETRRSSTAVNFDATKGHILRKKNILIVFLSKLSVVNRASKKYNRIRKVIDLVLFFTA